MDPDAVCTCGHTFAEHDDTWDCRECECSLFMEDDEA